MPTVELHNSRIYVWSELSDRDRIRQIPGANWDNELKQWHLPLSWGSCQALRGVFLTELQIGPELREWASNMLHYQVQPALSLRPAMEVPELMASEPRLYPFQRVGVRFLETTKQALLADDMGSGKTIQIIRAIARLDPVSLPALIVCPNSMKYTWEEEIKEWEPAYSASVSVIDGTAAQRRKAIEKEASFYIINWESLRLHSRLAPYGSMALSDTEKTPKELNAIDWGTVVADEGHRAKDPKSKQTRALWAVAAGAPIRFAATGTPIESHPGELWSVMHFVSPENFPRKTKYIDRYCNQVYNHFGGMEITGLNAGTAEEFHRIVDPLVLRRPKDAILPQLPIKTEMVRYIPFTGKQEKAYKDMAKSMIAEVGDNEIAVALNPLQQFVRLSQFASSYAELNDEGNVQLTLPSNKVEAFMQLLEEAPYEQVVGFAESKQLINLVAQQLEKKGVTFGLITGDTTPDQRTASMKLFQEGRLRVMLCTSAGAEGITLTAARILVFLQRFWSSIKNQQAADRVHRIGQDRGVEIITFATKGTVDEHREKVLDKKGVALQEVLKDDAVRGEMLRWSSKSTVT